MVLSVVQRAHAGIKALQPYQAGKPLEELERELGISGSIKLASNENPLGANPNVVAAIKQALSQLHLYPDANGFFLKQALAQTLGLLSSQLVLGNGSNDVLDLIARVFALPDSEVIMSEYAFLVYPIVTQAVGAKAVVVPAVDYGHDLDGFLAAITDATRLIFIANPNNPTGTFLNTAQLDAFLARVPESILVVLDEAYYEYASFEQSSYPQSLAWLAQYPNLVICRTFSKAYGLAALRAGYAIAHPEIADLLNRVRQPFNLNSLALVAAVTALADQHYLTQALTVNQAGKTQLEHGFQQLGLAYIPSAGNFICVHLQRPAAPIYQALLQLGVITRPVANYGLAESLRISIGLPAENERCLHALAQVLA